MNRVVLPTKTLGLLIAVVLLTVVFILQETLTTRRNTIPVPTFDAATIEEVRMVGPDGEVSIRRDGDRWVVGAADYPADGDAVASLLEDATLLAEVDIVTARGAWDDYGLDEESERVIRFLAADREPLAIQLGDTASDGDAVYGRINGSREIVFLPQSLDGAFVTAVDEIRETEMLSVDEENVVRVTLESPDHETVTVQRSRSGDSDDAREEGEPVWETDPPDDELGLGHFQNFFQELASMQAQSFIDGSVDAAAFATVSVELSDGRREVIRLFPPNENRSFPVTLESTPYAFRIPEWRARRLLLGRNRYFVPFDEESEEVG